MKNRRTAHGSSVSGDTISTPRCCAAPRRAVGQRRAGLLGSGTDGVDLPHLARDVHPPDVPVRRSPVLAIT